MGDLEKSNAETKPAWNQPHGTKLMARRNRGKNYEQHRIRFLYARTGPEVLGDMFTDFSKFSKERHMLYLKARQLAEYRHTPEPVQEAAQKLVDAMKIVGEAQVDLGTALAVWSSER